MDVRVAGGLDDLFARDRVVQSVRLSRTVPSQSIRSWSTEESDARSSSPGISPIGRPSSRIRPDQGTSRPLMSLAIVDFPDAEEPTRATREPGTSVSEKSSMSAGASGA